VIAVVALGASYVCYRAIRPNNDIAIGAIICGVVAVAAGITAFSCCLTSVPAGHRGVVVVFGEVKPDSLTEGLHTVNPFAAVHEMSVQIERAQNHYTAETSDTQTVTVGVQINWRPDATAMPTLFRNYGLNFADKILNPAIQEAFKSEVAKHKVTDLVMQRPQISAAVKSTVAEWIARHHLVLVEMAVADIDFSEKYDAAIENKQVEEQKAAQKLYELKRTVTEAEMKAAEAKGHGDSTIVQARADAEALTIKGDAQAAYNRRVAESLTPLLVQRMQMEKWDGKLPVYQLASAPLMTMALEPK
jgi:regulator of protease activity HflC (stomatin/prohibitin superfamily)